MAVCCLICLTSCETVECPNGLPDTSKALHTVCRLLNVALPDSISELWTNIPLCKPCSVNFFHIHLLSEQIQSIRNEIESLVDKFRNLVVSSEKNMISSLDQDVDDRVLDFRKQLIEDLKFQNWERMTEDLESGIQIEHDNIENYADFSPQSDKHKIGDDVDCAVAVNSYNSPFLRVKLPRLVKRANLVTSENKPKRNSKKSKPSSPAILTGIGMKHGEKPGNEHCDYVKEIQKTPRKLSKAKAKLLKLRLWKLKTKVMAGDIGDSSANCEGIQKNVEMLTEHIRPEEGHDPSEKIEEFGDNEQETIHIGSKFSWRKPLPKSKAKKREIVRDSARKSDNEDFISNNPHFRFGDDGKLFYKDTEILPVELSRILGRKLVIYGCSLCSKTTYSISVLQRHMDSSHLGLRSATRNTFTKTEDGRLFYGKTEYKYDQSHKQPFICNCSKRFILKSSFQRHAEKHWDVYPFYCEFCGKGFSAEARLQSHQKLSCDVETICDICGKHMKRESLYSHRKYHRGAAEIAADIAAKKKKVVYSCSVCEELFTHNADLKVHMKLHSGSVWKYIRNKFQCLYCGKRFPREEFLKEHEEVVHFKTKVITCEVVGCGKAFVSEAGRRGHNIRVHGIGEMDFACSICSKKFPSRAELRLHKSTSHNEGTGRIQCPYCDRKFLHMNRLKQHSLTHSEHKQFNCKYCDKNYKRKQTLRKHVAKHHPEVEKRNYF